MLKWIAVLLLVALVTGAPGLTGVANVAGKDAMLLAAVLIAFLAGAVDLRLGRRRAGLIAISRPSHW